MFSPVYSYIFRIGALGRALIFFVLVGLILSWSEVHAGRACADLTKGSGKVSSKKQEKLEILYEYFRFLIAENAEYKHFVYNTYRNNDPDVVTYMERFGQFETNEPTYIYNLARKRKKIDLGWGDHLKKGGVSDKELIAAQNKVNAKVISSKDKELEVLYEYFRFLTSEKAESKLFVLSTYKNNDSVAKGYIERFGKFASSEPRHISRIVRQSDLSWVEHLQKGNVEYVNIITSSHTSKKPKKYSKKYQEYKLNIVSNFIDELILNKYPVEKLTPSDFINKEKTELDIEFDKFMEANNYLSYRGFAAKMEGDASHTLESKNIFQNKYAMYDYVVIVYEAGWYGFLSEKGIYLKELNQNHLDDYSKRYQVYKTAIASDFVIELFKTGHPIEEFAAQFFVQKGKSEIDNKLANFIQGKGYLSYRQFVAKANGKEVLEKDLTPIFKHKRSLYRYIRETFDGGWYGFLSEKGIITAKYQRRSYVDHLKSYQDYKINIASDFISYLLKTNYPVDEFATVFFVQKEESDIDKKLGKFLQGKSYLSYHQYLYRALGKEIAKEEIIPIFKNKTVFYDYIRKYFDGGWYSFLSKNGINPEEVRRKGRVDYSKLSREHQIMLQRSEENKKAAIDKGGVGFSDDSTAVVIEATTPEDLLTEVYVVEEFEHIIESFNDGEAKVIDVVLDFLSDPLHEFTDLMTDSFNIFFKSKVGRNLKDGELDRLFGKIRENKDIDLFK